MKIKSIFEQISTEVFQMNNLDEMKRFTVNFVESKKIKDEDRKRIVIAVVQLKSVSAFHRYICNSLLKYEGMSLSKV
jgi:F0F1-type ATP synthase delta subunit